MHRNLESIVYVNTAGRSVSFGLDSGGVYANFNNLRDYGWKYKTINNLVSNFYREETEKSIPFVIAVPPGSSVNKTRQEMYECFETDVAAKKPGKIWINGFYLECYVIAIENEIYLEDRRFKGTLGILATSGKWIKEKNWIIKTSDQESENAFEFPGDFNFDLLPANASGSFENGAFGDSPIKITIKGPVSNPYIIINEHKYAVTYSITSGEQIVIDGYKKEIYKLNSSGEKLNIFAYRSGDYCFEKVPQGKLTVRLSSDFNYLLTIYEERSEPKWI